AGPGRPRPGSESRRPRDELDGQPHGVCQIRPGLRHRIPAGALRDVDAPMGQRAWDHIAHAQAPHPDEELMTMEFELTDRCQELRERLLAFMDAHIYPAELVYHEQLIASGDPHFHPPVMEELKREARDAGLWNLFHPHEM